MLKILLSRLKCGQKKACFSLSCGVYSVMLFAFLDNIIFNIGVTIDDQCFIN